MTPLRVVIDTDPGVDDFLAIALALNSPELEVEAFTTTGGNSALRHTNANALRALEAFKRGEVPVYRGAQRPLQGRFEYAEDVHGAGGLPIRLPPPKLRPRGAAVPFLADRLRRGPGLTIISLGPQTNIARLARDHPGALANLERVVIMGGAFDVPGNVTPFAEFNVWADPAATGLVLESGVPVSMIGSDVCNRVQAHAGEAVPAGDPVIRSLLEAQFAARPGRRITLYDPLTVMAVIEPGLLGYERTGVAVDRTDGPERGRTVRDPSRAPADIAVAVDAGRAAAIFRERVLEGRF